MSKIAIIVKDRQAEAIRMSSGITFMDDTIEIFFLDSVLDDSDEVSMMMEIATEMELPLYSNMQKNKQMNIILTEDLHKKLLDYDHIIAY